MKRVISIFMSVIIMVVTSAFGVSAVNVDRSIAIPSQEAVVETMTEDAGIETQGLGKLLASSAGTIYGSGTINVTLPTGNFGADFVALIGYSPNNSVVTCTVKTPDGDYFSLSAMSGTGSKSSYTMLYAPAGTYSFNFSTGTNSPVEISCSIYD